MIKEIFLLDGERNIKDGKNLRVDAECKDVIIISSVSCIYGLGSPQEFQDMMISLRPGMTKDRDEVIRELIDIQYTRNEMDFHRSTFRVRGDTLQILWTIAYRVGLIRFNCILIGMIRQF